jgi:hypothetical protein
MFTGNEEIYGKIRRGPTPNPDAYCSVKDSPASDHPTRHVGPYLPASSFNLSLNRYNSMNESPLNVGLSGVTCPYTLMGPLNIPAANGIYGPPSDNVSAMVPLNLPLSFQSNDSHFTSLNHSKGSLPIMEAATT